MILNSSAAGPESLVNYFQTGALLGQKAALNLWCVDTRPNSQKQFPSIWRSVIFGNYDKCYDNQIWQMLKCFETVFANLAWYRRTKDLVPLFDPKMHLFENSLLKIMARWIINIDAKTFPSQFLIFPSEQGYCIIKLGFFVLKYICIYVNPMRRAQK